MDVDNDASLLCDNIDCSGQKACRRVSEFLEEALVAGNPLVVLPCQYVEVLDLIPTPSVAWFVKNATS